MARIIVVDDELVLLDGIARYLSSLGHDVRVAQNGKEAMTALDEAAADLVITDLNMPDMDGIEILNALRERSPVVRVIAMSGGGLFPKSLLLDSAGALGAALTLEKPFELDELRRAVDTTLADVGLRDLG